MIKLPTLHLAIILMAFFILTAITAVFIQQRVSAQATFTTQLAVTNSDGEADKTSNSKDQPENPPDSTIKDNIKELVKEAASKNINAVEGEKKAIIGEVLRITDDALTIRTNDGQQIFPLNGAVITKNDEIIDVGEIAVDNWVTILGTISDKTIVPNFIFVSTKSYRGEPQIVVTGTVTQISKTSVTISPRDGSESKTLTVGSTTTILDSDGKEAEWSDFELEMSLLVVGFEKEDGLNRASTIKSLAPTKSEVSKNLETEETTRSDEVIEAAGSTGTTSAQPSGD